MNDTSDNAYENPLYNAFEASAAGREEAVNAIFEKGMALRDAAHSGRATKAVWQAHGALQIWRAAYAAAYREMLAINDHLEAYARGGGQTSEIPEHPDELERRFESYTRAAKAAGDEPWPF
jgi:hypothetical protein